MKVATSLLRSLEETAFLVAGVANDGEEYLEEATREIGKDQTGPHERRTYAMICFYRHFEGTGCIVVKKKKKLYN